MALRRPVHRATLELSPEAAVQQLVRVGDVLAEAGGVSPSPVFDAEAGALAVARGITAVDWSGRPVVSWAAAAAILVELREQQAEAAAHQARTQELAAAAAANYVPFGAISIERPGHPTWWAPGHEPEQYTGPVVQGPM
jgi:hypothetical protein